MSYGISREAALELLGRHLANPNMIKHCLATEAVMRALASRPSILPMTPRVLCGLSK